MAVNHHEFSEFSGDAQAFPYAIVDGVYLPSIAGHTHHAAGLATGRPGKQHVSGAPDARGTGGGAFDRQDHCRPAGGGGHEVQTASRGGLPELLVRGGGQLEPGGPAADSVFGPPSELRIDRKSTRLNSSHLGISYAV